MFLEVPQTRVLHGFSCQTKSSCSFNHLESPGGHIMTSEKGFLDSPWFRALDVSCFFSLHSVVIAQTQTCFPEQNQKLEFSWQKWLTSNLAPAEWWASQLTALLWAALPLAPHRFMVFVCCFWWLLGTRVRWVGGCEYDWVGQLFCRLIDSMLFQLLVLEIFYIF